MLAELKQCFLEAYDDNNDGKIDIREVKTKNIFCFLFGIHLHLLQKKLKIRGRNPTNHSHEKIDTYKYKHIIFVNQFLILILC